jgi:hypothetical protein
MGQSLVKGIYDQAVDRVSAYEILQQRAEEAASLAEAEEVRLPPDPVPRRRPGRRRQGSLEAFVSSTARSIGTQIGRSLVRGILGSLTGGRRR